MSRIPQGAEITPEVVIGDGHLELDQLQALATGRAKPLLAAGALERIRASYELTCRELEAGSRIYGVTTGYGNSHTTDVAPAQSAELSQNLVRFHGCGTGRLLTPVESAMTLAVRICSISAGYSGVRPEVAQFLCAMLEKRVLPAIPAEGSVGASGDLTPLSYVAAVIMGEREVLDLRDTSPEAGASLRTRPAAEALEEAGLTPLPLRAKEALALMNGTSVASALGASALLAAERLARLTATITALNSYAVGGNAQHFNPLIHSTKGHPGQIQAASWIRDDLGSLTDSLTDSLTETQPAVRLQDRYSIRCAPHVLGVLVDALTWFRRMLTTEINGVSDNPIVDSERGVILHGGNFYGGHVAFAMDGLKAAVASVSDLLDRQVVLLCLPAESAGLPENLVGKQGETETHHGFKAMSITASALTAEALKLTVPASAFSRSTESHNQDKVPMATIASRDALRVVELTEQVAAIALLAACQAAELRGRIAGQRELPPHPMLALIRERVPALSADRRMDVDITQVLELIRSDELTRAAPGRA